MRESEMSDNKSIRIDDDSSSAKGVEDSMFIPPKQVQTIENEEKELDNSINEEKEISETQNSINSIKENNINNNKEISKEEKSNISSFNSIKYEKINSNGNRISLILEKKKNNFLSIIIDKEKSSKEGHTIYEISIENKKSNELEKKILCYRRYDNFNTFYEVLNIRYPQYIFPKLSPKKILAKVYDDEIFLEQRRNELQYFLNEIYNHSYIGRGEEIKNFLNGKFDKQYFNSLDKYFNYSETIKKINDKGYINQGVKGLTNFINYFAGKKSQDNFERKNSKKILEKNDIIKKKIKKYNLTLNELKNFYEALKDEKKEEKFISNNLLYLKNENNKIDNEDKKNFNEIIEINQNFNNDIYNNYLTFFENEIIYSLDYCILYLEGEKGGIERYIKYLEDYNNIINYNKKEKDSKKILEEQTQIKKDIDKYENTLIEEMKRVEENSTKIYNDIIHRLSIFLNNFTETQISKYKNCYFSKEG